jgi:NDP-sugar pyrophosphorylase family protein
MMDDAPWMRLQQAAAELQEMQPACHGSIHPLAVINGVLELGEGSVIKPGTVIEGHVRVGKNCSIGPNAYLRGDTIIGDNCIIGNAVEIKSSILGNAVFVSHLTYIGDSVLEDDINVGGGCIFSNFRHDAGEIRMPWQGELCPTGRNKLGCLVGEHCRIGCKCVILPGRVLPPGTWTDPGSVVR